jgi:hypothetical protein
MMCLPGRIKQERTMERFVTRHNDRISGILSGFDRMIFRGTLRSISYAEGLEAFLATRRVWLKDFGAFAHAVSEQVKRHAEALAVAQGRPFIYLASSAISKEDEARAIMTRDGIDDGLICVLSCVEPCRTFTVERDRAHKSIRVVARERKCLHLYFYYVDREFGVMHVRVQTWLPLTIDVYINGRSWLARRLTRAGVAFTQVDNTFTAIADVAHAQHAMNGLVLRNWTALFDRWARRVMPWLDRRHGWDLRPYYWTSRQSEVATDVMFQTATDLATLYPRLTRHAIDAFHPPEVLRFLGRRFCGHSTGEVTTTFHRRPEGVCVRHRVEENSVKMYDKAGSVLRIETTINNPRRFLVRRRRRPRGPRWAPLRKGLIDLTRRVHLSEMANAQYLDALAVVGHPTPSAAVLDTVTAPAFLNGHRHRPLRPIDPADAHVERALLAQSAIPAGFRLRDLAAALSSAESHVYLGRKLRLYRAHGLIARIPATHRYRITPHGHLVMTTALRFRDLEVSLLAA